MVEEGTGGQTPPLRFFNTSLFGFKKKLILMGGWVRIGQLTPYLRIHICCWPWALGLLQCILWVVHQMVLVLHVLMGLPAWGLSTWAGQVRPPPGPVLIFWCRFIGGGVGRVHRRWPVPTRGGPCPPHLCLCYGIKHRRRVWWGHDCPPSLCIFVLCCGQASGGSWLVGL